MAEAHVGSRLRTLRRRARMTQAKLAEKLGISASYLNLIEHNKRNLSAELMFRAAEALELDVRQFATEERGALLSELQEALADPELEDSDVKATDVRDLVDSHPGIARTIVDLHRRWREATVTVQSLGAMIPVGEEGSLRMAGIEPARLPSEEVNDLIAHHENFFEDLEAAAESLWRRHVLDRGRLYDGLVRALRDDHRVTVRVSSGRAAQGVVREYDRQRRVLMLSESLPTRSRRFQLAHQLCLLGCGDVLDALTSHPLLTTDESRTLGRMVLANYFAGAVLMPYEDFWRDAEADRYDLDVLSQRFRVGFEQVCHRLTTLQRPHMSGVRFHLLKCDTAGNISKRFSGTGIQFARFGAGCPRWNVNQAFLQPGRYRLQVSEMPDGQRYFCVARTVHRRHGGYKAEESVTAVGLGCQLRDAHRLVYADGLDLSATDVVPIGVNCRVCDRMGCQQRAFPSTRQRLRLDSDVRRVGFYATKGPEGELKEPEEA